MSLKKGPFQKERIVFQPLFSGNGNFSIVFGGVGPAAWIAAPHRGSWLINPLQVHGKMTWGFTVIWAIKKGPMVGWICVNDVCRWIILGDYVIILCYILLASMMEWYEYEMKQWWYYWVPLPEFLGISHFHFISQLIRDPGIMNLPVKLTFLGDGRWISGVWHQDHLAAWTYQTNCQRCTVLQDIGWSFIQPTKNVMWVRGNLGIRSLFQVN